MGKYHYTRGRLNKESTWTLELMYEHFVDFVQFHADENTQAYTMDVREAINTLRRIDSILRSRLGTTCTSAGAPNDR